MDNSTNCKKCGNLIQGRLDKKFCDAYCRNSFNNTIKRKDERSIIEVNRVLRKNRTILKTLSPVGKSTVRKEVLDATGYNFNIFSSMYRASKSSIYYLCHEYGFCPILDSRGVEKAVIINRQSYMPDWKPWKYVHS